jgi:hypothetical protein
MAIWYISLPFGNLVAIWYIFPHFGTTLATLPPPPAKKIK